MLGGIEDVVGIGLEIDQAEEGGRGGRRGRRLSQRLISPAKQEFRRETRFAWLWGVRCVGCLLPVSGGGNGRETFYTCNDSIAWRGMAWHGVAVSNFDLLYSMPLFDCRGSLSRIAVRQGFWSCISLL